jgi:hypothetical protein
MRAKITKFSLVVRDFNNVHEVMSSIFYSINVK